MTETKLLAENIGLRFGNVVALNDVSVSVDGGELVGLIGPNGSGKSTLLNCISRFYRHYEGSVTILGQSVDSMPPHLVARLGVARTFQNVELFPGRSVLDNVILGLHSSAAKLSLVGAALRTPTAVSAEEEMRGAGERALALFGLADLRDEDATSLPYGTQKLVELARAVAPRPSLLLLDEPAAGMNREERRDLARSILRLRAEAPDIALVWVEHDLKLMADLCDRLVALTAGAVIAAGSPDEVLADSGVIESYGAR